MDVVSILKKVAILNGNINSLVAKGSQLTPLVAKLVDHINLGKMIYDSILGNEKPDQHWHKATLILEKCNKELSPEVFSSIISDIEKFSKPHKLNKFKEEFEKWLNKDSDISLNEEKDNISVASNIQNLLKVASYIQKKADDHISSAKIRLARLIDGHVDHIIELINNKQIEKAKEYLGKIRPNGWEDNAERNIDKLYEQVIRALAEKLEPEDFQAIGL